MSPYISINVCEIVLQTLNCYYISYFAFHPIWSSVVLCTFFRVGELEIHLFAQSVLGGKENYIFPISYREFFGCVLWHLPSAVPSAAWLWENEVNSSSSGSCSVALTLRAVDLRPGGENAVKLPKVCRWLMTWAKWYPRLGRSQSFCRTRVYLLTLFYKLRTTKSVFQLGTGKRGDHRGYMDGTWNSTESQHESTFSS